MNNNENKKKSEIVYKTVEETIVVTEEDVDVKWIEAVNDSMREDANYARKERYHCYRLDIADDKDEWVASQEHDPFYNLCRETTEEELNELATAKCSCDGALAAAWKESVLEVFRQDLEVVFGKENGDIKKLFGQAGEMIMRGRMKSLTVKQSDEKSLNLKLKNKGLCITVTEKSKMENISYG